MRHKGEGDVTKLPKWAQDRISILENNLAYANREIENLSNQHTGGVKTRTYVEDGFKNPKVYLPDDSEVTFEGDAHNEISLKRTFDFAANRDSATSRAMKQKPGGVMNVDILHQSFCAAKDGEPCDCKPKYRERRTRLPTDPGARVQAQNYTAYSAVSIPVRGRPRSGRFSLFFHFLLDRSPEMGYL